MSLRTDLSAWVDRVFGRINAGDFFHINETAAYDKAHKAVRTINMELKKDQGWQKAWSGDDTVDTWQAEIDAMIERAGLEILKREIKSAEAKENKRIAGLVETGRLESNGAVKYGYRFKLEIICRKKGKANG